MPEHGKGTDDRGLVSSVWELLAPKERWQAAGLAVLALAAAIAEALGIGAVFPLLSLLTNSEAMLADPRVRAAWSWTGAGSYEQFVLFATAALLLLFVIKNLFLAVVYHLQTRFICTAEARIGTELTSAYLHAPYVERAEQNSADRIRIITTEVARVTSGFVLPLVNLVAEGLVVVALIALLIAVQPQSALLALVLMAAVGGLAHAGFRGRLNAHRQIRVAAHSAMFRAVSEGLSSLKETKVLMREQHFVRWFRENSTQYARSTNVFMTMNLLPRLIVETAAVAALAACIMAAIVTKHPLSAILPVLTVFGLATVRMMPSVTRMLGATNNLRYYAPSVRQVSHYVLSARRLPREQAPRSREAAVTVREIELRAVSYTYPGAATPTLNGVSLRVSRGEIIALTGRSGSGKTTLADILLGLIVPDEGSMAVNGTIVNEPRTELGPFAGFVPQHFFILDDTVRRNVAFGVPEADIDDEKVWKALTLARMAQRVREEPALLEMATGEDGAYLSGGERQRLCIARALYHDPGLLVFDEATSALDETTEAEIVETIQSLAGTKAVLVIAHRPALLRAAHRVFVLENGRLEPVSQYELQSGNAPERPYDYVQ